MSFVVTHRIDLLLQKNTSQDVPPQIADTYIGRVTHPHQAMLLQFLNERLAGHRFQNYRELNDVLACWPKFALERGLELDEDWNELSLYRQEREDVPDIACGSLVIAHLVVA